MTSNNFHEREVHIREDFRKNERLTAAWTQQVAKEINAIRPSYSEKGDHALYANAPETAGAFRIYDIGTTVVAVDRQEVPLSSVVIPYDGGGHLYVTNGELLLTSGEQAAFHPIDDRPHKFIVNSDLKPELGKPCGPTVGSSSMSVEGGGFVAISDVFTEGSDDYVWAVRSHGRELFLLLDQNASGNGPIRAHQEGFGTVVDLYAWDGILDQAQPGLKVKASWMGNKWTYSQSACKTTCDLDGATLGTMAQPVKDTAYSHQIASSGVNAGSFSASNLPTGLSISTSGLITGTPTQNGTWNVIIGAVTTTNGCVIQNSQLIII